MAKDHGSSVTDDKQYERPGEREGSAPMPRSEASPRV